MQVDMIRKYIPDIIAQAGMFEIVDSLYVSKIKIPLAKEIKVCTLYAARILTIFERREKWERQTC